MIPPDVIIGGAPKCGTSSLFNWLAEHPDICGASPKETFFFMDRDHPLKNKANNYYQPSSGGYLSFYQSPDKLKLEGTTHYLYQKNTPKILSAHGQNTKVIFVLREPSSRVYSSFNYTRNNLAAFSSNIEFQEYVNVVLNDEPLKELDKSRSAYVLRRDINYGKYVEYLSHWYEYYDRNKIKIILYEELRDQPVDIMNDLCAFIGIDGSFFSSYDFVKRNQTVTVLNRYLHGKLRGVNRILPENKTTAILKKFYFGLMTSRSRKVERNDEQVLADLKKYYRTYNEKLSLFLDRNLSIWNT